MSRGSIGLGLASAIQRLLNKELADVRDHRQIVSLQGEEVYVRAVSQSVKVLSLMS